MAQDNRTDCDTCRAAFAPSRWDTPEDVERKKDGPPCWKCRPDVLPENTLAVDVYRRCSGQLIMGMGGAVDINLLAVKCVLDMLHIEESAHLELMEEVQLMAQTAIVVGREKQEQERNRGKAQG
ncbi:DUF1799 domain-containing protein [Megalodesulfovibrio gigas]|uniref:Uncharacterized protein n=1 Tax=Megalodesulfovibrio gigas (strain ATCC 19364 / DSM 1382 / NCIMB 9332 / VKM B-1759) TaxID=1121448 RepID=T2GBX8_MEGG1|nr:DUF1799 domain-containing protein [Megalodesulfovibrio gigas]AGW13813.1 hypothetical protein DGI_2044 [Megalodesulfovibrio gigas DSM 1382 = ATCC 19364]